MSGRRPDVFSTAEGRPSLIAHGAGNSRPSLDRALAAKADFVEVDLWVHKGRFESRHERRLPPVPLLVDSWALRWPPTEPLSLAELLDACRGRSGVLLDLKNCSSKAVQLVRATLQRAGSHAAGSVLASSQSWPLLRALREACPQIRVLYSVDIPAQLELFESVSTYDRAPAGISCRHSLLSERSVGRFHRRGLVVAAWTVDDEVRAAQLRSWGIDAITTKVTAGLRPLFGWP